MNDESKELRDNKLRQVALSVQTPEVRAKDDERLRKVLLEDANEHREILRRSRELAPRRVFR